MEQMSGLAMKVQEEAGDAVRETQAAAERTSRTFAREGKEMGKNLQKTWPRSIVDVPLSWTMFVVAHFHMVMGVAPIMVIFGGSYHWYRPRVGGQANSREPRHQRQPQ
jgi:hypothetical protein